MIISMIYSIIWMPFLVNKNFHTGSIYTINSCGISGVINLMCWSLAFDYNDINKLIYYYKDKSILQ